jgi:hypothetical protein
MAVGVGSEGKMTGLTAGGHLTNAYPRVQPVIVPSTPTPQPGRAVVRCSQLEGPGHCGANQAGCTAARTALNCPCCLTASLVGTIAPMAV